MTRTAAVLGWPIEHSKSPAIMNAAFAATGLVAEMIAIAVRPEDLAAKLAELRALPMLGASVTVPHKLAVAALCDELSAAARAFGAVKCLVLGGDLLTGHNTDAPGFRDSLAVAGFDPRGKHCVLLGAGGAARAVAYALGDATVSMISRSANWTDANLRAAFARAALVVDCTPTGLAPDTDEPFAAALPLTSLAPGALVATLVYHRRTSLLERASALGYSTLDGRGMLVHQAAHAFEIWTGQTAPIAVMARALDDSVKTA